MKNNQVEEIEDLYTQILFVFISMIIYITAVAARWPKKVPQLKPLKINSVGHSRIKKRIFKRNIYFFRCLWTFLLELLNRSQYRN